VVSPLLESISAPELRYPTTKTTQIQSPARPDLLARKDVAISIVVIVGPKNQIRQNLRYRRATTWAYLVGTTFRDLVSTRNRVLTFNPVAFRTFL